MDIRRGKITLTTSLFLYWPHTDWQNDINHIWNIILIESLKEMKQIEEIAAALPDCHVYRSHLLSWSSYKQMLQTLFVYLKIDVMGFVFMMFGTRDIGDICCSDNKPDNLLMLYFIGVHITMNFKTTIKNNNHITIILCFILWLTELISNWQDFFIRKIVFHILISSLGCNMISLVNFTH